jgi:hypothetical protein
MFRVVRRSSSGALTVYAASGLHTHVVTGRSQVWVGTEFPLRLDYGRLPQAYVNQRLQIQLVFLMMRGVPLETCWAFKERWNNKFCYKVASCWLFLLNHTAMHGSINIKWIFQLYSYGPQLSIGNYEKKPNRKCRVVWEDIYTIEE